MAAPGFEVPAPAAAQAPLPASPPPEVLASLDTAARVMKELAAKQVNLHFEVDEKRNTVRVEVRDGDGRVIRQIPASKVLDVLAGDHSGLAVDAHG